MTQPSFSSVLIPLLHDLYDVDPHENKDKLSIGAKQLDNKEKETETVKQIDKTW